MCLYSNLNYSDSDILQQGSSWQGIHPSTSISVHRVDILEEQDSRDAAAVLAWLYSKMHSQAGFHPSWKELVKSDQQSEDLCVG